MKTTRKAMIALPAVALVGVLGAGVGVSGAQASGNASVTVIHGIPDTPVDVYVNDKLTLDNFMFKTVTDPLSLPAGSYKLDVRGADAAATAAPILSANANVPASANISVIAHLDAAGQPKITPFVNDTKNTSAGQGRLVVRHTAAAPAVDVLANGQPAFRNLTNPNSAQADLPAGTIQAAVALAGTTAPVIGPAAVPVTEGQATIVYAVGSASANNLTVVTQSVTGLHSAPSAVNTGNSGLAAESTTGSFSLLLATGVVLAGAFGVTGAVAGRRMVAGR